MEHYLSMDLCQLNELGYCRSGFDCEILMIANCEFFWSSQSKESQSILECITIMQYGVDHCNRNLA